MGFGRCFPWKTLILLLTIAIVTLVNEDVKKNGSFKKSRTGAFLGDVGLYNHAVRSYEMLERGQKWTVENVPVYYNRTREVAEPYCAKATKLAGDLRDYVKTTTPVALDKVGS